MPCLNISWFSAKTEVCKGFPSAPIRKNLLMQQIVHFICLFLVGVISGYLEVQQFNLFYLPFSLGGNKQNVFCFPTSRPKGDRLAQMWNHFYRDPLCCSLRLLSHSIKKHTVFYYNSLHGICAYDPTSAWDWYLPEWQHNTTMPLFLIQIKVIFNMWSK